MRHTRALPAKLAGEIEATFTDAPDRNLAYKIADYLLAKYRMQDVATAEYIDVSSEHFRGRIGTHYGPVLSRMKSAGIVQAYQINPGKEFYIPGSNSNAPFRSRSPKGQSKSYRFAPECISGDPVTVQIEQRRQGRAEFAKDYITRQTVQILSRLELAIPRKRIDSHVDQLVTAEYITDATRYRTGDQIPDGVYQPIIDGKRSKNHITLQAIRGIAAKQGKQVILYRGRCYVACPDQFIRERMAYTRIAYRNALYQLKDIHMRANIRCERNDTNNRLDTNITNMPNSLIPLLRLDGEELVNIDLSNSQFTLLAYVIQDILQYINELDTKYFGENTLKLFSCVAASDQRGYNHNQDKKRIRERMTNTQKETIIHHIVTNTLTTDCKSKELQAFGELTKAGTFYETFGDVLSVEGYPICGKARDVSKGIMFLVAFASHRYRSTAKTALAKHFPALVELMDGFKKGMVAHYKAEGDPDATDKGNAELAVMLQQIESSIFIDGILNRLLGAGYRVFTKHDSILCKRSDLAEVLAIVREELDAALEPGGYRVKWEDGEK